MKDKIAPVTKRIPCLDGIRAISITLVFLAHFVGTVHHELPGPVLYCKEMGNLGVRTFFVISGFLITTLLISEYRKTGTISLLKFYFNRTFRIFPAFYAFIIVMAIANALGYISLREGDMLHAVTYTTNYHYDRAWELGHLWSLAVEEQFYLLWPAMFLLFGMRGALFGSTAYIIVGPVIRILTWHYLPHDREGIGESFQTVADSIATGCVFAFVKARLDESPLFTGIQKNRLTIICLILLIAALNHLKGYISFMYPIGETALNLSVVLSIDWCLRNSNSLLGRFLNAAPIAFIGVLSYSLYLWQQPFLSRNSHSFVASSPVNLICAFSCALVSFYLVEKPFLGIRGMVARKWSAKKTQAIMVGTSVPD